MSPGTSYDSGFLFAQIVATMVAEKHPREATIERSIKARGRRVYVDYMQNVLGKTLASAYSARASEFAGVSTPLTWDEVEAGVSPRDFTIANFDQRMKEAGDIWAALRKAKPPDLGSMRREPVIRR
jgi:bifunctional non-homologous end joining protein LigD